MTPEQAAHETRDAIVTFTSGFMTDPASYAYGQSLGFDGFDFYIAGRGGVLGDVPADVVVAALVYFADDAVRPRWERAGLVMTRRSAAQAFAQCARSWALDHVSDDVDAPRLAALLGQVVARASVAGAPLFAGWRLLEEPHEPKALVVHRLNALRELRGAVHGAAVLTVGLRPIEAVVVRSPKMAPVLGWPEPYPDPEPFRDRWQLAEARTDRVFGRHLAVLDEHERAELVELLAKAAT